VCVRVTTRATCVAHSVHSRPSSHTHTLVQAHTHTLTATCVVRSVMSVFVFVFVFVLVCGVRVSLYECVFMCVYSRLPVWRTAFIAVAPVARRESPKVIHLSISFAVLTVTDSRSLIKMPLYRYGWWSWY